MKRKASTEFFRRKKNPVDLTTEKGRARVSKSFDQQVIEELQGFRDLMARMGFAGNLRAQRAAIREKYGEDSLPDLLASYIIQFDIVEAERATVEAGSGDVGHLISEAAQRGQLRERVHRRYGIDPQTGVRIEALAHQGQGSRRGLKNSKANADRHFMAENWHDEARAIAVDIRKRRPNHSTSQIAHLVIDELRKQDKTFNKAHRTVRDVI